MKQLAHKKKKMNRKQLQTGNNNKHQQLIVFYNMVYESMTLTVDRIILHTLTHTRALLFSGIHSMKHKHISSMDVDVERRRMMCEFTFGHVNYVVQERNMHRHTHSHM